MYASTVLKVSSKSTYAIRALIQLGREFDGPPIRLNTVAEKQSIPLPYLEQIFSKLRRAGVVQSIRGPQGGYKLVKNPHQLTLAEIITVLEGPIEPLLCSMPENKSPDCHEVEGCVSRAICNELDGAVSNVLLKNTLGSLCGQADKMHQNRIPIRST